MFIIRKIGKTLRGQAKPYQIITAAILGALIGFAPPITNAPLYMLGLILLLSVLNANFFIATATAGLCKLLALVLMPVSFELGLLLVDGPLQPLFKTLINAPVTALMGFDYYVTAGGTVIGLAIGIGLGVGYLKIVSGFRKKMADVEAHNERYANYVQKRSVRILMWVLFGGKAKVSYAELAEQKKFGNPIRPLGVVFAVLLVGLLFILQQFASGPLATTLVRGTLEKYYGATVDLEGMDLNLSSGQVTITRLAMADPDNLEYDLLRANQFSAKISTADLLRKRFTIDSVVIDDAVSGAKRDKPGVLIHPRREPSKAPEKGKSIEDYIEDAEKWKKRLQTIRDWLEKLQGPPADDKAEEPEERDRLREWAERYGHANVRAAHLVEQSPTILVKDTKINKMRVTWPEDETMDVHATNLSSHPALAPDKPRITVVSSKDTVDAAIAIAPAAMPDVETELKFTVRNQSVDEMLDKADLGGDLGIAGGTWQAGVDGKWSDLGGLNLPLAVVIQNTNLKMPSIEPTPVERLPILFTVIGPIDNPGLDLDTEQLRKSLMDNAGKAVMQAYTNRAKQEIGKVIGEELGGDASDLIGGLIGGNRDKKNDDNADEEDGEEKDGEEEKSKEDAVKDRVRDGLGDLLNR